MTNETLENRIRKMRLDKNCAGTRDMESHERAEKARQLKADKILAFYLDHFEKDDKAYLSAYEFNAILRAGARVVDYNGKFMLNENRGGTYIHQAIYKGFTFIHTTEEPLASAEEEK